MSNIYQRYTGECYEHLGECLGEESLKPMVIYRVLPDGERYVMQKSLWEELVSVKGKTVERFKRVETDLSVEEFEEKLRKEHEALNKVNPSKEKRVFEIRGMLVWPWFALPAPYLLLALVLSDRSPIGGLFSFLAAVFVLVAHFFAYSMIIMQQMEGRHYQLSQREYLLANEEMQSSRYAFVVLGAALCVVDVVMVCWCSSLCMTIALIFAILDVIMTVGCFALIFYLFKPLEWSLGKVVENRERRFFWYRSDMPVGEIGTHVSPKRTQDWMDEDQGNVGSLLGGFGAGVTGGFMASKLHSGFSPSFSDNAPLESIMREEDSYHNWACGHEDPYDCNHDDCY